MEETRLELLVLFFNLYHLIEELRNTLTKEHALEKGLIRDILEFTFEKVSTQLLDAKEDLNYRVHIAVVTWIGETNNSGFFGKLTILGSVSMSSSY